MDRLSGTFQALADPTRRAILARLALGETSVSELAEPFDMSQPAISKHLKVLERAGLISRSREAQYRPCRLEPQALKSVDRMAGGLSPPVGSAARPAGAAISRDVQAKKSKRENEIGKAPQTEDIMTATNIYAERTVTLTRILKAPRDLVWQAWTDPAMLKQWWGPEQFTNPVVEGDVKVGGVMHITMHGPKDSPFDMDFPMVKRYREIVPGKKLVFENEPSVRMAKD